MDLDKIFKQKWSFRQVFVEIVKDKNSTTALVTNDRNYVDKFSVQSESEADFMDECKNYLESDRFKEKLKQQRGF